MESESIQGNILLLRQLETEENNYYGERIY